MRRSRLMSMSYVPRRGASWVLFGLSVVCLGLVLSLTSTPALGQAATGTIIGQVTDQQNAVIGGANIRLVDPSTSSVRTAVTNEAGRYTLVDIPPGTYEITVTKAGFAAAKLTGQKVDVGEVLTLNVPLQVGATTTTVEVQATAGADLQTLNATIGTT